MTSYRIYTRLVRSARRLRPSHWRYLTPRRRYSGACWETDLVRRMAL
jgi:hypothetical protein